MAVGSNDSSEAGGRPDGFADLGADGDAEGAPDFEMPPDGLAGVDDEQAPTTRAAVRTRVRTRSRGMGGIRADGTEPAGVDGAGGATDNPVGPAMRPATKRGIS